MTPKATIFGIGHSIHEWGAFVALLQSHQIRILVDVRSSPKSRWPQFNKPNLERLREFGIQYVHRERLGGKNPLPADQLEEEFRKLFCEFDPGALRITTMCSEGNHEDCHRHYLLTPVLLSMGYLVAQVQRDGSIVPDFGPTEKTLKKMAKWLPKIPVPQLGLF
jgi:uncharacterized protein (DUF488 family)